MNKHVLSTGPYYRYRTYWDHIYRPLSKYVDGWPLTLYKLKLTGCFIILYFIMNALYPSKVSNSDSMLHPCSQWYNSFYITVHPDR